MSDSLSLFELFIDLSGELEQYVSERSYLINGYVLSNYIEQMIPVHEGYVPEQLLECSLDVIVSDMTSIHNELSINFREQTLNLNSFNANT